MNYFEAMELIKSKYKFGAKLGLFRMERVLEKLGNPHKKLKAIHIAGTNGKGSAASGIAEVLKECGYKVGLYISPYIDTFEERISINGESISKEDLAKTLSYIIDKIEEAEREVEDSLTEFEIITLLGFQYFYDKNVDYVVLETGLGGRLDATNVVTPLVSCITSISLDHMEVLGDTLEKIAYEKAGIIKKGVPVVLFPQGEEAFCVIKKRSKEMNAKLYYLTKDCIKKSTIYKNEPYQDLVIETEKDIYDVRFSLVGEHQKYNCAMIIRICEALIDLGIKISKENMYRALSKVKWIGRLEIVNKNPIVVLDGAHNEDAMISLVKSIQDYFSYDKLYLVIGMLRDKSVNLKDLIEKAHKVYTTQINISRTLNAEELYEICKKYKDEVFSIYAPMDAIINAIEDASENDMVLICGSFYLIGEIRRGVIEKLK